MSDETKIDWSPPMPDDRMAAAYQSAQAKLTRTAGGEVRNTLQNFVTALTHDPILAGNIRRNLFKERMSMTCPVWWTRKSDMIDDMDVAFLRLYLEEHYGLRSEKLIYPALNIVSTAQAFHPVRDRLNRLVWDGEPRVRMALHHFLGAEVSDTNEKYLRIFMLGAVNRVFHPSCKFELMLVLVGGQGAGKTTFIRFLALEPEWFTDDVSKLDDKEIYHRLNGHWICELSEMVATANAKSIEEIKSFLSRDKDFLRMAYDRYGGDHPRQSVFAGTTNRMDFLPLDRSGNRRFLPVTVDASKADCHILDNPVESRHYFEQLWAEIMVQYKSGAYTRTCPRRMKTPCANSSRIIVRRIRWRGASTHGLRRSSRTRSVPCRFTGNVWRIRLMSRRITRRAKSARLWTAGLPAAKSAGGRSFAMPASLPSMGGSMAGRESTLSDTPPIIRMSGNMPRNPRCGKVFRGLTCRTHPNQQNKLFQ